MLTARLQDQENLFSQQAGAATSKQQQLQSKGPGTRYPKTPLKVPLNDENANFGGGKSALRTKGNNENIVTIGKGGNGLTKPGKANLMTPAEPRTARAPLGNKTTNAKAKAGQQATLGVKDIVREFEKTTIKPANTQLRPQQGAPKVESSRLEVHTDKTPLDEEDEVEYCPPKPKDLPYQSDVFPDGVLTFEGLKPENMFKGYYQYYFNHVDENGTTRTEREMEAQRQRAFELGDEQIRRDMEEFDWSVDDVPASKDFFKKQREAKDNNATVPEATAKVVKKKASTTSVRPPSTLASRRAASALSSVPSRPPSRPASAAAQSRPTTRPPMSGIRVPLTGKKIGAQPKPALSRTSSSERATAVAASRSTLGYSKGRAAISAVHGRSVSTSAALTQPSQPEPAFGGGIPRTLQRTASSASSGSDCTITPARFAKSQDVKKDEWKKLEFLSIFDVGEEDDADHVAPPDYDLDDDFQMTTDFGEEP
ncbi:hypothetical protein QBC46DRAFT_301939 [Diplogelasinospora grovesii]|uniref:Uncharacterized protein n=1 Tax=Diplogelasinospora grovesii TaxID=303347 RepID=A0AAN6NJ75_9PEZI|nr:hypothetical protein QBC46DRAFT_301939 [Diplogelasinospora grovesii]